MKKLKKSKSFKVGKKMFSNLDTSIESKFRYSDKFKKLKI